MNKRNEGYALVLVLVVMVVLCLVAVSILSISASNLKKQQDSIERMQAKYEAQGKLEQAVSQLEKNFKVNAGGIGEVFIESSVNTFVTYEGRFEYSVNDADAADDDALAFDVTAVDENSRIRINCRIEITGDRIEKAQTTELYTITNPVIGYASYEITFTEPTEGGAAQ